MRTIPEHEWQFNGLMSYSVLPIGALIQRQNAAETAMIDTIALIHKQAESDFDVSFPDYPGCVTAGRTLEEARAHLEDLAVSNGIGDAYFKRDRGRL